MEIYLDCDPFTAGFIGGAIVVAAGTIPIIVSLTHKIDQLKHQQSNEYHE